jgi:uncharacterized membrane protein (UPF0127 family)
MNKKSSPHYSEEPESKMYDSERSIALPENDGSFENGHGTLNPAIQLSDDEDAIYDGGFSDSAFSPLEKTDEDFFHISSLSNALLSKVGRDATLLLWGSHDDKFLKNAKKNDVNLISLNGEERVISSSELCQKYSDPMFYFSRKKADGFLNTKPFCSPEQAAIALKNIYSNLRPIAYSLVTANSSIDIEKAIKKSGFIISKKIAGKINKYLLKKNELNKTALIKCYDNKSDSMSVFRCDIADTHEEKAAGLQPYNSMSKNCGLLFRYASPRDLSFHMASVKFPIDIIFIDDNFFVKKVFSNIEPGSLGIYSCSDSKYVLETIGGISASAGIDVGKRLFVDFDPDTNDLKKESNMLSDLGLENFIIKRTSLAKSSVETFEKYSVLTSGGGSVSATSLIKKASINYDDRPISIFYLNDFVSKNIIPLNRIGKESDFSARLSAFSGIKHTTGDIIKVSFDDFVKENFYSKLSDKYFASISDVIYSINNYQPRLLEALHKSSLDSKLSFVYSSDYDPDLIKEAVEISLRSRFGSNIKLSSFDCFRVPHGYGPEDIILAAEYRYGNSPVKVISGDMLKSAGIPVPDVTKNVAKKSIRYLNRAKKLSNKLIENFNKNKSVYEKLREKPNVIKNSAGEYRESAKRNSRISKRILLNVKEAISLLSSIQDVSTTEEAIGSLADTAKTFSESIKEIFDLVNIIDTDEFSDKIVEFSGKGVGAIDDLKITIDRCKNYVTRDILGSVVLAE